MVDFTIKLRSDCAFSFYHCGVVRGQTSSPVGIGKVLAVWPMGEEDPFKSQDSMDNESPLGRRNRSDTLICNRFLRDTIQPITIIMRGNFCYNY